LKEFSLEEGSRIVGRWRSLQQLTSLSVGEFNRELAVVDYLASSGIIYGVPHHKVVLIEWMQAAMYKSLSYFTPSFLLAMVKFLTRSRLIEFEISRYVSVPPLLQFVTTCLLMNGDEQPFRWLFENVGSPDHIFICCLQRRDVGTGGDGMTGIKVRRLFRWFASLDCDRDNCSRLSTWARDHLNDWHRIYADQKDVDVYFKTHEYNLEDLPYPPGCCQYCHQPMTEQETCSRCIHVCTHCCGDDLSDIIQHDGGNDEDN
jgi:hypothetical protein